MKNFHKILFLTATLSCFAVLPGRESSAMEFNMQEPALLPNPVSSPALRGDSFNENVFFARYDKNILQGDSYLLELKDLEEGCDVSFKSSDTDVLTVKQLSNTSCSYTGTGYGTAKITATITKTTALIFKEKKTIRATVKVTPKAVSVMFRQNTRKVSIGKKLKLPLIIRPSISEEVPVFKSSDKRIVTVNKNGKITGKKLGKTYVTATLQNGKTAKCRIIVLENAPDDTTDSEPDTEN